jgi:UPF0716 protein FxsA
MHGAIIQIKGVRTHLATRNPVLPYARRPQPLKARIVPLVLLILIGLPLLEIATFVVVGSKIGVLWTIALVVLSSIAGSILLRIQGFGVLTRARRDIDAGRDPGRELAHGAMILLAGILLLLPGFVTDMIGLLLFIPPVRDLAWRFLRERVTVNSSFSASFGRFGAGRDRGPVVDLDEGEFRRTPDPKSPWRIGNDR